MLTTTREEADRLLAAAKQASYKAAHRRMKLRRVGREGVDSKALANLTLTVWGIEGWQQGKFTHEEYTNKINNAELVTAFAKIRRLINEL
jgi:hypothetical protein